METLENGLYNPIVECHRLVVTALMLTLGVNGPLLLVNGLLCLMDCCGFNEYILTSQLIGVT